MVDYLVFGVTPTNADNPFAASRLPIKPIEEPIVFITRYEVEAMLKGEKEKASILSICLDLKPTYTVEVAVKLYPFEYITPQFQKCDGRRGNMRSILFASLSQWELTPRRRPMHERLLKMFDRRSL